MNSSQCLWCKNDPPDTEPGAHHAVDCRLYQSPYVGPDAPYWDQKLREKLDCRARAQKSFSKSQEDIPVE